MLWQYTIHERTPLDLSKWTFYDWMKWHLIKQFSSNSLFTISIQTIHRQVGNNVAETISRINFPLKLYQKPKKRFVYFTCSTCFSSYFQLLTSKLLLAQKRKKLKLNWTNIIKLQEEKKYVNDFGDYVIYQVENVFRMISGF